MSTTGDEQAAQLIARLEQLDTCAVSDALDRLGLPGAVVGLFPVAGHTRLVGRALTMRVGPFRGEAPTHHLGVRAIEAGGELDVVVIEHRGPEHVAAWGGLLSLAARQRRLRGAIVDGACRDVDDIRKAGFAVFARRVTPITARGRVVEEEFGIAVTIGSVLVRPGDLLIADSSGVVFVPQEKAQQVVTLAESLARQEEEMAQAILRGVMPSQVLGRRYETMLERDDQ